MVGIGLLLRLDSFVTLIRREQESDGLVAERCNSYRRWRADRLTVRPGVLTSSVSLARYSPAVGLDLYIVSTSAEQ